MKHITFNCNDKVKVILTNIGIEYYVQQHNRILDTKHHTSIEKFKNMADEFGYHEFQLWDFMDIFGCLGMKLNNYVDINFIFKFEDFEPFEFKSK